MAKNKNIFIIIDLNVWNQDHKGCNRICTIKSENLTCSDTDMVKSLFQFDINLPVNVFSTGTCKSCFNITEITITCKLNMTNMQSESHSTQNLEITTAEMKSRSSGKFFLCFRFFVFLLLSE